jgi:NADH-quinone oxidoreductase subunit C
MTPPEIIAILQDRFGPVILAVQPEAFDPFVQVEPAKIAEVCAFLKDDPRLQFDFLNNLSGVDYLEPDAKKVAKAGFEPHLEVLYHMSSFAHPGRRFTLKVVLPRANAEIPTVSSIWRTADWHEREVYDLFGIHFAGHPDLRRILLSDDWIGFPMLKDYEFPLEYADIRCR